MEPEGRRRSRSEEFREREVKEGDVQSSYFDVKLQPVAGEQDERRGSRGRELFWRSLVESAACSEVAVNLLLPSLVCSRRLGAWRPPSEWVLLLLTLVLNLGGSFLEGFFKSTRLLSQTVRWSQKDHLQVFVTAEAFSAGFLSVATSFPGVSGSASGIPLGLNTLWFGALFSFSNMLLGLLCYLWGCRLGRSAVQRRWAQLLRFAHVWPQAARAATLLAVLAPVALSPAWAQVVSFNLPLDLAEPELRPSGEWLPKLRYNGWTILECPSFVFGLLCGIGMSVVGAALATFFCGRFDSRNRPAARLLSNVLASLLAYVARAVDAALDSAQGGSLSTSDFLRSKFVGSFCGALSAFSGTIGDIADMQLGSATEDSVLDEKEGHKSRRLTDLSKIPAVYNFLLHWVLTLLVMWGCARFESWPHDLPTPLPLAPSVAMPLTASPLPARPLVRSHAVVRWGVLEPDNEV